MRERTTIAVVLALGLTAPIVAATVAIAHAAPSSRLVAWAAGLVFAALSWAGALMLRRRLPATLDGAAQRRPLRAILWMLLALLALAQLGRLSAFMADPANVWGSAFPDPGLTRHACMSAYVHAGDLSRRHDPNVYDERHWPAADEAGHPAADKTSPVAELGDYIEDPYEYPPQFLLLPQLGLALTDHFLVLRAVWFAVQAIAFILVALALAAWIGGREGLIVGLLTPLLVGSLPGLVNLQWGQAHLLTFTLSLGALMAFARGRAPLGGLLLGAAIVFKIFPGLLLVYMALRRRWRDVGWTLAAAAALTLVTLAVVGTAPFVAFVRYQLPRISSGEAFTFFRHAWFYVSRNFGVSGIVFKLGLFGVPHMTPAAASLVGWIYSLALLALAGRAARQEPGDRLAQATMWVGLLNLASLRSPLAPSIYASVGAHWLLTLLAARVRRKRDIALIVVAWIVIPGTPRLPQMGLDVTLALVGQLAMLGLSIYAVWRPRPAINT